MPMIRFLCNNEDCGNEITKVYSKISDIASFLDCGACGVGKLERTLAAPTTKSTQMLDNGLQTRKLEIMNAIVDKEKDRLEQGED